VPKGILSLQPQPFPVSIILRADDFMMNRDEVMKLVKEGKRVVIMLDRADVVMCKSTPMLIRGQMRSAMLAKLIVKDSNFGTVYFSGFSEKLFDMFTKDGVNAQVSLKVTVTGVGDPNEKYPEPMLFAKPHLKKGDPLVVDFPVDATKSDDDLPINV
jgi:hypothetical protein